MGVIRNRVFGLVLAAIAGLGSAALAPAPVYAQPAGVDPGKDCQTIRSCNYGRRGVYRGCISTYACRQCRFVSSNCTIDGQRKVCRQLKCGWGSVS